MNYSTPKIWSRPKPWAVQMAEAMRELKEAEDQVEEDLKRVEWARNDIAKLEREKPSVLNPPREEPHVSNGGG